MKTIENLLFEGKRVLIRVDFNVPLNDDFSIRDDSRLIAALPTIKKVIDSGGKVILLSHLGRPIPPGEDSFSLQHIVSRLSNLLGLPVMFIKNYTNRDICDVLQEIKKNPVILLENLRFHPEEKKGDLNFAQGLSRFGDFYINDAFGVLHRNHASVEAIAAFFPKKKAFGYLIANELKQLKLATEKPLRPVTAIIGGAKISGKIDLISSLFKKVDNILIGGAMAYTFIKAMGGNVSNSLFESKKLDLANFLIKEAKKQNVDFLIPIDSVNGSCFNNDCEVLFSASRTIPSGFMGLDIGKETIALFEEIILNSKTIIWNGPMGVFEMSNFSNGTKKIAEAICFATKKGAFSLVGGGDSVAAIKKFGLSDNFSYVSTGGGVMLEYLEGGELPGITAIED